MKKKKVKPKYNTMQMVLWMLGQAWRRLKSVPIICVLLAATTVGLSLTELFVAPEILKKVETAAPVSELLITICIFTGLLFVLTWLKNYIQECSFCGRIDVRVDLLRQIEHKASSMSYPLILDVEAQKLHNKSQELTNGNDQPTEQIWKTLTSLLTNVAGFVIYLLMLTHLNPLLLTVVIITAAANFFASRYASQWQYSQQDRVNAFWGKWFYITNKSLSVPLAKDIRIFGLADWLYSLQDSLTRFYASYATDVEKKRLLANAVDIILNFCRNGLAYFYLISMVISEGLPASEFILYFAAISGFTTWITGILAEVTELHRYSLEMNAIRAFLELPEPFRMTGGEEIPEADGYELKLENVSFRYPGASEYTLKNVDLTIKAGEKIAIVGLNGAGKTTLVKLFCGLLDPDTGSVKLNGQDIRKFNRPDYYRLFSSVFQDFSMLDVTVAENVAQTWKDIDRRRVDECIRLAGLSEKISSLPNGIDTYVGREVWDDGVVFSGGETQRLMLARALYKDGPILVLDEPTAALDPLAENDIYMKYNDMTAGKTAMFISHRLASTRFCDRIIFIADGGIAEEGTHDVLLKKNGKYAELFEIQSRYYREGRDFE